MNYVEVNFVDVAKKMQVRWQQYLKNPVMNHADSNH